MTTGIMSNTYSGGKEEKEAVGLCSDSGTISEIKSKAPESDTDHERQPEELIPSENQQEGKEVSDKKPTPTIAKNPWSEATSTLTARSSNSATKLSFQSIMKQQEEEKMKNGFLSSSQKKNSKKRVTILDTKEYINVDDGENGNKNSNNDYMGIDGLDEEEMIRLAIEASLKEHNSEELKIPSYDDSRNNSNSFSSFDENQAAFASASASASPPAKAATGSSSSATLALLPDYEYQQYPEFSDNLPNHHLHDTSSIAAVASAGHGKFDAEDEMDEDMKLAIRLSLQEMNGSESGHCKRSLITNTTPVPQSIITSPSVTTTPMSSLKTPYINNLETDRSDYDVELDQTRRIVLLDEGNRFVNFSLKSSADCSEMDNYQKMGVGGKEEEEEEEEDSKLPATKLPSAQSTTIEPLLPLSPTAPVAAEAAASSASTASTTTSVAATTTTSTTETTASTNSSFLTKEEEEQIAQAILRADDEEMAKSLALAMKLNDEEERNYKVHSRGMATYGDDIVNNVRLVSQQEYNDMKEGRGSTTNETKQERRRLWSGDDYELHQQYYNHQINLGTDEEERVGYQINSSTPSEWSRYDKNTIIGPNNEIRTKHDVSLKNQRNAEKLLSNTYASQGKKGDSTGKQKILVNDYAYNSFRKSIKNSMKRGTVKGVLAHGTGRAENMNAEKTRGGAMDGNVRLLISKAITNGLIQYCNGVIKEGKEAIVYHADGTGDINSEGGGGFDVAVKVFKHIQEFRGRSAYIDGDPRYHGQKFSNIDKRQRVEVWTEKEYRNLLRASRAGVPVPTPLMQKENVLFMKFLGECGWPAPQLREIQLRKSSKKWTALYIQTLLAVRRLYHCAELVHGDLSEYNILVCPMSQVENSFDKSEEAKDSLQIVLIDFGQAVQVRHPSAGDLLRRDLTIVKSFFHNQGIATLSVNDSEQFVLKDIENNEKFDDKQEESSSVTEHEIGNVEEDSSGLDDVKDMEWIETKLLETSSKSICPLNIHTDHVT